ncbi:DNA-processing protein DprA [Chlamydiota bacterium]
MTNLEALIILNALSLGPKKIIALWKYFSSFNRIFDERERDLLGLKILTPLQVSLIKKWNTSFNIKEELILIKKEGVNLIPFYDQKYPERLKMIYDPPPLLYTKGLLTCDKSNAFAVVGSRRATIYGTMTSYTISYELAQRGITIVSGVARGIDRSAHKGALDARGSSIGVLGNGIAVIYPAENKDLYNQLAEQGLLISEFSMRTKPYRYNFPRRNRLLSALSLGVLVVEATQKSGSLLTVQFALEQGRSVFAVPGKIDSPLSAGPHGLIKDGACLVTCADDITVEIREFHDLKKKDTDQGAFSIEECSVVEKKVYTVIRREPISIDSIVIESGLRLSDVVNTVMSLQLKKIICELPGKRFIRA